MKIEQRQAGPIGSKRFLLAAVWLGVFLIAAYDIYFAWMFREVFASWELNPVGRWGVDRFGLPAFLGFKLAGLCLAVALVWHCRRQRRSMAQILTVFVVSVHAWLAVHYAIGHQQPSTYDLACRSAALYSAK